MPILHRRIASINTFFTIINEWTITTADHQPLRAVAAAAGSREPAAAGNTISGAQAYLNSAFTAPKLMTLLAKAPPVLWNSRV